MIPALMTNPQPHQMTIRVVCEILCKLPEEGPDPGRTA
jgi:hypothetical protein